MSPIVSMPAGRCRIGQCIFAGHFDNECLLGNEAEPEQHPRQWR